MLDITWLRPKTIPEALQMLAEYGDEGKLVAGGTWVSLVLKQRLLMPSALIYLGDIPGLDRIEHLPDGSLRIGALVTHRAVELSPLVREHSPLVSETFATVANVRVRCQATVGGVLCDADYASDPPAALAALQATVIAVSRRGQRAIPVSDFIVGHYATSLQPDEIVTHIVVPKPAVKIHGVYLKYRTRSHEDRPCVGVAVAAQLLPDGRCQDLQVVVGAVADTPKRIDSALHMARNQRLTPDLIQAIADRYAEEIDPLGDLRASSEYRKAMVRVFVKRAIQAALSRNPNGGAAWN